MPNITTLERNAKNETDVDKLNLRRIVAGAEVYYNFTGQTPCLNLEDEDQIGADMWDFQVKITISFVIKGNPIIYFIILTNQFTRI